MRRCGKARRRPAARPSRSVPPLRQQPVGPRSSPRSGPASERSSSGAATTRRGRRPPQVHPAPPSAAPAPGAAADGAAQSSQAATHGGSSGGGRPARSFSQSQPSTANGAAKRQPAGKVAANSGTAASESTVQTAAAPVKQPVKAPVGAGLARQLRQKEAEMERMRRGDVRQAAPSARGAGAVCSFVTHVSQATFPPLCALHKFTLSRYSAAQMAVQTLISTRLVCTVLPCPPRCYKPLVLALSCNTPGSQRRCARTGQISSGRVTQAYARAASIAEGPWCRGLPSTRCRFCARTQVALCSALSCHCFQRVITVSQHRRIAEACRVGVAGGCQAGGGGGAASAEGQARGCRTATETVGGGLCAGA